MFEKNGFRFDYNPEKEPRRRLSLTALPHSGSGGDGTKAVQFGKEGKNRCCTFHYVIDVLTFICIFTNGYILLSQDVGALCAMLGADGTTSDGHIAGFGTGADGSGLYTSNAVRRFAGGVLGSGLENRVIGSSIVRLPKAIAMFASRACRVSFG